MSASFLCDRETTIVAKEQPGFCNYIVIPIWNLVSTIMPQTEVATNRALENVVNWQQHEESQGEREVYTIKRRKTLNLLKKGQELGGSLDGVSINAQGSGGSDNVAGSAASKNANSP